MARKQEGQPSPAPGDARAAELHSGPSEFFRTAPSIGVPKGGGAIRGIDEKFSVNPATGTGSYAIPLPLSPGRSGFQPSLAISYDSGSGNGPFGLGWSLAVPAITRKTDKGLPRYRDAEESDVFVLSGSEDLVPVLRSANGAWVPSTKGQTLDGRDYFVDAYRPRVEGLFARIERWTEKDSGAILWRSISKDNITTWYGRRADSRIADPENPSRV